ncbi:TetR/AcrR family transcriptional regulator [Nocardioides sp. R-C-SC26]|uniref:TetR/AcrR family transcriptional regulator n=1 Tax=Nocardioides sp. R-C-SC26 TaxID=2870414 RepID=UPI001E3FDA20|nr:TetR/AcrR family transcriptional regulator [Nocardioides sp. R-C-SC26]
MTTRPRSTAGAGPARGRRRSSHSLDAVLDATVQLLDEAGGAALTFRSLAARLRTGVGTIYWYVASKEELLDRATDHALGPVLEAIDAVPEGEDPIDDLRRMAIVLFDAIVERPWLSAYFMRSMEIQVTSLRLYERLGRPTLRMDLTPRQRFHAVSAVTGFAVGTAADLGQEPPEAMLDDGADRDELLHRYADRWRALDADDYPFVHDIVDEFDGHDDVDQFRAGLELILAGLRLEAAG